MGKHKKKQKKYFSEYYRSKKKNKKNKKGKSVNGSFGGGKKKARLKTVQPTLDRKEAKESRKIVLSPVDVPKKFKKNRDKCNHVGELLSVEAFKRMTPSYSAYTPALDRMVAKYGEEHVSVCGKCYDVVVDRSEVSVEDVQDAVLTLYAACNVAVSNTRLKKDEVKKISDLKDVFGDYQEVIDLLDKIERHAVADEDEGSSAGVTGNRNSIPGSAFVP